MSEASFYSFMGFDSARARKARAFYVPLFRGCRNVLDVGCGRGEFLEELGAAGIPGVGVDQDAEMVAAARKAGLMVELADAFAFLRRSPSSFDGIFSAHLIEHLPYDRAAELLGLCFQALQPGGRIVVCTPNSASLPTLQHQFWWEPTHVRLYDIELLRFMLAEAGFTDLAGGENPDNHPGSPVDLEALTVSKIEPLRGPRRVVRRMGRVGRTLANTFRRSRTEQLDQRTQADHHHLTVVAESLKELLRQLYVSSEVYVSGRKSEPAAPA